MRGIGKAASGARERLGRGRKPAFQQLEERHLLDGSGILVAGSGGNNTLLLDDQPEAHPSLTATWSGVFGDAYVDSHNTLIDLEASESELADKISPPPGSVGNPDIALIDPFGVSAPGTPLDAPAMSQASATPLTLQIDGGATVGDTGVKFLVASSVTVSGVTAPHTLVHFDTNSDGAYDDGLTASDAAGEFSKLLQLGAGQHRISARVDDGRGGFSYSEVEVVLDPFYSGSPTLYGWLDNDTGLSDRDGNTSDASLIGFGASSVPVDRLKVGVDSTDPAALVDVTGLWVGGVFRISTPILEAAAGGALSEGDHTAYLVATTTAGTVLTTTAVNFHYDTVAPEAATAPFLSVFSDSDTGADDDDDITAARDHLVRVGTEPAAVVRLYNNGVLAGEGSANPNASSTTYTNFNVDGLADGTHAFRAAAEDLAGNVGGLSPVYTLTIDTLGPETPEFGLSAGTDTGATGDNSTTLASVDLVGVTHASVAVALVDPLTSVVLDSTTADGVGAFTFVGVELEAGTNLFRVEAVDVAGNVSAASVSLHRDDVTAAVVFSDADVEDAVRRTLGQFGEPITRAQLGTLTSLLIDTDRVSSLGGLEYAVNLKSLRLLPAEYTQPSPLADLTPILGLTKLEELAVVGSSVSSAEFSRLASLPVLQSLDVRYGGLADVTFLTGLSSLREVRLWGNDGADLAGLQGSSVATDLPPWDLDKARDIAAIAAAHHYQPIELYEHVLNTIEFEVYGGALKSSQAVIDTGAANDVDSAAYLIDLLEASGIDARFASGRVSAKAETIADWIGTRENAAATGALSVVGYNADTFIRGVISGDPPVLSFENHIEFDHTWVEAWLDVPGEGPRWVSLDPSWKFKDRQDGISGILEAVPFDSTDYLSELRGETAAEYYLGQVEEYVHQNYPGRSVSDISYDGPVIATDFSELPTELPYDIDDETPVESFESLPTLMTHRISVSAASSSGTYFDHVMAVADVGLETINLAWDSNGSNQHSLQLLVGGQVVASTPYLSIPNPDNSGVTVQVEQWNPGDDQVDRTYGDMMPLDQVRALGIDAHQVSPALLHRLQKQVNEVAIDAINGERSLAITETAAFLAFVASTYVADGNASSDLIYEITDGYKLAHDSEIPVASGWTFGSPQVEVSADLPNHFIPQQATIDFPGGYLRGLSRKSDQSGITEQLEITGYNWSVLEATTWEKVANTEGVSTIRSLQLANENGIPVFTIDESNRATLVSQLTLSTSDVADINERLDEGAVVTVPRDPTPLNDWNGVGYIADADTYTGYLISGGLSGGYATASPGAPPPISLSNSINRSHVGDPVDIANGNVIRDELDIELPGIGLPLRLVRHYDSQSEIDNGFGPGWSHSYSDFLAAGEEEGELIWCDGGGRCGSFLPDGQGGYVSPDGYFGELTSVGDGYEYREKDGLTRSFDSVGRLTGIEDRNGNGQDLNYNGSGELVSVVDSSDPTRRLDFTRGAAGITALADFTGRTWTYAYDGAGRLASAARPTDPSTPPSVTQYEYYTDTAREGLIRLITQPDGGHISYDYYPDRRAFQVTDQEGHTQTLYYNLYRKQTTYFDGRDVQTVHEFNLDGNLVSLQQPDLTTERHEWVDQLLMSSTDPFGNTDSSTYDAVGNVLTRTDRAGETTTYTYDPVFNQVMSITRPDGVVTNYSYDGSGNLLSMTDAVGGVQSFTYDTRGQLLSVTSPRGNETATAGDFTTTYTYNAAGLPLTVSSDLPSQVVNTYDSRGYLLTRTDAVGNTTTFTHDAVGRVLTETDAEGGVTTVAYDAVGNRVSETDALGRTTTYAYNLFQKPVQTVHADGSISAARYDRNQNRVAAMDAEGHESSMAYDGQNRIVHDYAADGSYRRTWYDANDNVVRAEDELGNPTLFTYDAEQRLLSQEDALGGVMTYEYDVVGNRVAMTDARGARTKYEHDDLYRIVRIDAPERQITTIEYDANGNVVSRNSYELAGLACLPEDLSTLPADRVRTTTFAYDTLDRQTSTTDALGGVTSMQYDAAGNMVSSTDELGRQTSFGYDGLNRRTTTTDALGGVTTIGYDAVGNVVSTTDAEGRQWSYVFDARNRQVVAADALGGVSESLYDAVGSRLLAIDELGRGTESRYDERRRVTSLRDREGFESVREYDARGNEVRTLDARGNETEVTYDALNRAVRMLDGGVAETIYSYDAVGNVTRITDPNGNATTFIYDLAGRETESRDALGGVVKTSYDSFGNATATRDAERRSTFYSYDALDRLVAMADPNGNVFRYSHDAVGNVLSAPNALNRSEQFTYDVLNRELTATDATGAVTTSEYDAVGNLLTVTDALGRVTTYAYDDLNRLVTTTDALGQVFTNTYDAASNLLTETDPLGDTTAYAYDALDRVVEVTDPVNAVTTSHYDGAGNLVAVVDALGRLTSSSYDTLNRLTASVDALGYATTFLYDAAGNLLATTDAEAQRTEYEYDDLDRRTKTIEPLGQTTTFTYDAVGNLLSTTDQVGETTAYAYNVLDQQVATTDALGATTWRAYNVAGDLTSLLDASGNLTRYAYDGVGRVVQETDPLGAARFFVYDPVGNLVAATDRNGRKRTMAYDDLDRLKTERWFDGPAVVNEAMFTYDAVGRTLTAEDNYSAYAYGYDDVGRLLTITNAGTPGVPTVAITHVRDAVGNVTSTTERINGAVDRVQAYEYDADDRLVTIRQQSTGAADKRVEFAYDGVDLITAIERYDDDLGGQLVVGSDYNYDENSRLTLLNHQRGGGGFVNSYVFNYDDVGRITLFFSADGPVNYAYDARGQLVEADASSLPDEDFAYDDTGNRTGGGYATGAANRQESDGVYDYAHDAEGNLTRRTEISTGQVREFGYDHDNRLVRVTDRATAAGPATQVVEYAYDVNGRRIARTLDADGAGSGGTQTERYVYDGSGVALRFDGAGTLTDRYLHGPIVDQVLAQDDAFSGDTEWLLNDHQQTVRDIVDDSGALRNHLEYSSFGAVIAETDAAVDSLFGYTGRERDTATDLNYNRARWYDPETGRFLSEDPIGFDAGDENLYRYVGNSPVNFRDPSGNALISNYYRNSTGLSAPASSLLNQSFSPIGGQSISPVGGQSFPTSGGSSSLPSSSNYFRGGALDSVVFSTGLSSYTSPTTSYSSPLGGSSSYFTGGAFDSFAFDTGLSSYSNPSSTFQFNTPNYSDVSTFGSSSFSTSSSSPIRSVVFTDPARYFPASTADPFSPTQTFAGPASSIGSSPSGGSGGSFSSRLDTLQLSLDIAGLSPAVGIFADAANTLISLGRGNWADAGLNALAMVPILGQGTKGAQLTAKAVNAGTSPAIRTGSLTLESGASLSASEKAAANTLTRLGYDVRGLTTASQRGISDVRTPDLHVDGIGRVDVFSPRSINSNSIARAIEKKGTQASVVFVQGNVPTRVQHQTANQFFNKPSSNAKLVNEIIFESNGSISRFNRP